jgi:eukaryotic-like serine/threonine-protein kinase
VLDLAKIEEIYYAALEKPPTEREAFLRETCGNDDKLRREVESLLSFDEKARDFIETPPDDLAAAFIGNRRNEDFINRQFNHYRVLSLLGAGGMGEVYLAEDTKLGRKIALKLLPPQLSANPERKARFEQEARAASALNHPNIITIYGVEEFDGFNFIATEFIDGETLRQRLEKASFSVAETLDIAIQLASALEAAHSVGIIHRDIKPANIMIRRDRIAKILDFGLAKLTAADSGSFDTNDLTGQRRVMGTINYMSPEQALGERVDARTDIFSLGVVLYEMLTGVQPFKANSEAAIYNKIINKDAEPITEIEQSVPPDLEEVINRAMKKEADERFQTAADLRVALENVRQRLNTGEAVAVSRSFGQKTKSSRNKIAVFAAFATVFLAMGFLIFFNQSRGSATKPVRNVNYAQLTKLSGAEMYPSLSPDGKTFLYSSRAANGKWDVFFQRVGGMKAVNLTKDSAENDLQAVYSPDGDEIAFRSDRMGGGIFLMGATGENVRRLTDFGFYPAWSPDGREIVFSSENFEEPMNRGIFSYLWTVNIATGEKRKIIEQDAIQPSWSPSGARIAFWGYKSGGQRDVWTISADGTDLLPVTDDAAVDWNPVWSPDGKFLYFISDRGGSMNLWRVPVDEKTGKVSGEPETITTPSVYTQHLTFSRDGRNFAYSQAINYSNILKADFELSGNKAAIKNSTEVTQGAMLATNPEPSPDGEWIAFDSHGDKQEDIFIIKKDGTGLRQLTNDAFKDRVPRWSPDGKQIAFFSDRLGKYTGLVIDADGGNLRQATEHVEQAWAQTPLWSAGGDKLIFNRSFSPPIILDRSKPFLRQTPQTLEAENPPERWVMMTSSSPDAEKLAGYMVSGGTGEAGIFVYSFETRRYEKMSDFGVFPVWLEDSRRLLFYQKDKIHLLDSQTKKSEEILSVAPNRVQRVTVSKDNRTVFYSLQKTEADIWLGSLE